MVLCFSLTNGCSSFASLTRRAFGTRLNQALAVARVQLMVFIRYCVLVVKFFGSELLSAKQKNSASQVQYKLAREGGALSSVQCRPSNQEFLAHSIRITS
ncbi:hypothetical protein NX722_02875 [Endozoicomonas gorgoniicola]|uniref:Secreted protein n=1 Tax=Endozoicomonas gorgoniicola TaxID=1234144 RepID=A0ABT3MQE9_9GAMM|nr:hypothetical protein [Endozoicomonas gorgoniicola]MCW7551603.1 hypothetical protein [Endozoicomonas gorgoniicola]